MLVSSVEQPFCLRFRTERIHFSKIRYYDLAILLANVIFLLFLLKKTFQIRRKLNLNKPFLLTFLALLVSITLTNLLRCLFVIIFPEQEHVHVQEILAKCLWLLCRFVLFWTELNVLLFGLCFGTRRAMKIVLFSCLISAVYITIQAVFEFHNDTRPIQYQSTNYKLYSSGGMKFLLISSSIFFTMYIINFFVPCLYQRRHEKRLPIRRSFYLYCFVLALINLIEILGTSLNLASTTIHSLCLIDGATCLFATCFAPFVYFSFLHRYFSSKLLIPQVIYDDSFADDDDDLIDRSTHDRLDGQFEDITSSTRIIELNL